jgi:hypothetical protein
MGRPPIGKVAMSGAERMRRLRAKHPVTKPVTKPASADSARLEARIRKLEDENANLRDENAKLRARAETRSTSDGGALAAAEGAKHQRPEKFKQDKDDDNRISKLIRRLDSPEDNAVLKTARSLVSELQTDGKNLQFLSDLFHQQWKKENAERPTKPKPIDYSQIEAIVRRYTDGKTKVNIEAVVTAIFAEVPAWRGQLGRDGAKYIERCMQRRGFTLRGRKTWERKCA